MTIADLIHKANGEAGAWRVERWPENVPHREGRKVAVLWHYSTPMLHWNIDDPTDTEVLDWSIGHGSVSDQNGMNTAFRILGLPYRFDRDRKGGGPRVTDISDLLAAS